MGGRGGAFDLMYTVQFHHHRNPYKFEAMVDGDQLHRIVAIHQAHDILYSQNSHLL